MPQIRTTINIQKPLFEVSKTVGDFATWETWQPTISQVTITSGDPIRAGTMVSMVQGNTFINADVLIYQRNKEIQLKGMWGRFRFTRHITFQSRGSSTDIDDVLNIHMGILFFWYAPILQILVRKQVQSSWNGLKQHLNT